MSEPHFPTVTLSAEELQFVGSRPLKPPSEQYMRREYVACLNRLHAKVKAHPG